MAFWDWIERVAKRQVGKDTLPIELTGSKVEQATLTTTPLAAGATYATSWVQNNDGRAVGFLIKADTLVTITLQFAKDVSGNLATNLGYNCFFTINPVGSSVFIPPIRVGAFYKVTIKNPSSANQTFLEVHEIRQYGGVFHSQAISVLFAKGLAIRDTSTHSVSTDPQYAFVADIGFLGDGTHPIFVKNSLDQQITVTICYLGPEGWGASLGNFTVAAGASVLKTNFDFPGLDIPTQRLYLTFTASAIPTTGSVDAYTICTIGG